MTQNLLITLTESVACADMRSRQFLQCGYIGFRFMRYHCSPWLVMLFASLKLLFAAGEERTHVQVRYFNAIARIDFVGVYGLLNDLLW